MYVVKHTKTLDKSLTTKKKLWKQDNSHSEHENLYIVENAKTMHTSLRTTKQKAMKANELLIGTQNSVHC